MATTAFAACADKTTPAPEQDPAFTAAGGNIIGGFATAGDEAFGTVGLVDKGEYKMLCSATLIAPQVVLTAKSCALFVDDGVTDGAYVGRPLLVKNQMAFATGNAVAPTAQYEIVDVRTSPLNDGGFVGLGNNVAVYFLKEAVVNVKTINVSMAAATNVLLGKKAVVMGYGSQTHLQDLSGELDGTRRAGQMTIANLEGNVNELAYGSFDGFWTALMADLANALGKDAVADCLADGDCTAMLKDWYNQPLLAGSELWAAKAEGDAVACNGDTGGPLLKKVLAADGTASLQVLGVISGGVGSMHLACDYGTVVATFPDEAQDMLKEALAWVDPCLVTTGVTMPTNGQCDGTVVSRCVSLQSDEGERRVISLDCADLLQVCTIVDGQAACADSAADDGGTTGPTGTTGSGGHGNGPVVVTPPKPGNIQTGVERFSIGHAWSAKQLFARLLNL